MYYLTYLIDNIRYFIYQIPIRTCSLSDERNTPPEVLPIPLRKND